MIQRVALDKHIGPELYKKGDCLKSLRSVSYVMSIKKNCHVPL